MLIGEITGKAFLVPPLISAPNRSSPQNPAKMPRVGAGEQEQSALFAQMCFGTVILVNVNFVMPMVQEFP